MDIVNAFGVLIIEYFQYRLDFLEGYFELINDVSNPNHLLEIVFPFMSIIDSVFASQLLLCVSFGSWLNTIFKWWLLEDRPYWWVSTTDLYEDGERPHLRQTEQTCETGPGSPSGHSCISAMFSMLAIYWMAHVISDRHWKVKWWKYIGYPVMAGYTASVMLARMYVGTHFPHQVLFGALLGAFLGPFLCLYVIDPYVYQLGAQGSTPVNRTRMWHTISAAATIGISVFTYYAITLCGADPFRTIKLAFRHCQRPHTIQVSTTPMYALTHSTGYLLGWALSVTPAVAQYRHNTPNRSLLLSAFGTGITLYITHGVSRHLKTDSTLCYYLGNFLICVLKVPCLLRIIPSMSMYAYDTKLSEFIPDAISLKSEKAD